MTFRLRVRGRTRQEIDAELREFAERIRARMNASPQPVEIIVPAIDVLNPGGGHQALLALLALVRHCFDPEGYEATVFESDAADDEDSGPPRATPCSYKRTSGA